MAESKLTNEAAFPPVLSSEVIGPHLSDDTIAEGGSFNVFNFANEVTCNTIGLTEEDLKEMRRHVLETSKRKHSDLAKTPLKQMIRDFRADQEKGLSTIEAHERAKMYGLNEMVKDPPVPVWKMVLQQLANLLVVMLIISAIVSFGVSEFTTASVLIFVISVNVSMGVIQEAKAGAAIQALEKLAAPHCQVHRDGKLTQIDTVGLVPGDIVALETGQAIPADIRLIESQDLLVNEMALTGESDGVKKDARYLPTDLERKEHKEEALTDRNFVYMGCTIQSGRGLGMAIKTGMHTKMGEIAHLLKGAKKGASPLQKKLRHLGSRLAVTFISLSVLVFLVGLLGERGTNPESHQPAWLQMLLISITICVAAVPEGLPACVTITLAAGMQRMAKKHALIRNLHCVETLGSAAVICSDKTGTLTKGVMTAVRLMFGGHFYQITDESDPSGPKGTIIPESKGKSSVSPPFLSSHPEVSLPLFLSVLCSNAILQFNQESKKWEAFNNPSERPLVIAAHKVGISKRDLDQLFPRIKENPFNSQRKAMSTLVEFKQFNKFARPHTNHFSEHYSEKDTTQASNNVSLPTLSCLAVVKGAPNIVLDQCISLVTHSTDGDIDLSDGKRAQMTGIHPMTIEHRQAILQAINTFSDQALRVLAVAYRPFPSQPLEQEPGDLENNLIFAGLIASIDPEREEVKASIEKASRAGIRVVMITGDYLNTAQAIAKNIGLLTEKSPQSAVDCEVIRLHSERIEELESKMKSNPNAIGKGEAMKQILAEEAKLDRIISCTDVFARAKPSDKITIVRSLQRQGHVCAMTGDGVNDAPALRQANIGVAMGITGTDIAKGSADMILTDDNFASIVEAVEEGRTIFANITKFVFFLLSTNISEVLTISIAVMAGFATPLEPIQILWINLTTSLPALALALEEPEPGIMEQRPRLLTEPILDKVVLTGMLIQNTVLTIHHLGTYFLGLYWYTNWNGEGFGERSGEGLKFARSLVFCAIVFSETLRAYTSRSLRSSVFKLGVFRNHFVQYSVLICMALALLINGVPGVRDVFDLNIVREFRAWAWILGTAFIPPVVDELTKVVYRRTGFGLRPQVVQSPEMAAGLDSPIRR